MKVTIFTDASVNPKSKNCGYAFYIGCRLGKVQQGGALRVKTGDPDTAEIHAIGNAISKLGKLTLQGVTSVELWSDSLNSVNMLTGKIKARYITSDDMLSYIDEVRLLCIEFAIAQGFTARQYKTLFTFRHIKGHTGKDDKHSRINNWCDQEAKRCRWEKDLQH